MNYKMLLSIVFSLSSLVTSVFSQGLSLSDHLALQPGTVDYTGPGGASARTVASGNEAERVTTVPGLGSLTDRFKLVDAGLVSVGTVVSSPLASYREDFVGEFVTVPAVLSPGGNPYQKRGTYDGVFGGEAYSGISDVTTTATGLEEITVDGMNFDALKVIVKSDWNEGDEAGTDINTLWLVEGWGIMRFRVQISDLGQDLTFDRSAGPDRPASPSGLVVSQLGDDLVLSWDRIEGIQDYLLFRSVSNDPSEGEVIATVSQPGAGNKVNFSDSNAVAGTKYYYFVQSRIGGAKSVSSPVVEGRIVGAPPSNPTITRSEFDRATNEFVIAWQTLTGVTYQVESAVNFQGNWMAAGPAISGTGEEIETRLEMQGDGKFFRVRAVFE